MMLGGEFLIHHQHSTLPRFLANTLLISTFPLLDIEKDWQHLWRLKDKNNKGRIVSKLTACINGNPVPLLPHRSVLWRCLGRRIRQKPKWSGQSPFLYTYQNECICGKINLSWSWKFWFYFSRIKFTFIVFSLVFILDSYDSRKTFPNSDKNNGLFPILLYFFSVQNYCIRGPPCSLPHEAEGFQFRGRFTNWMHILCPYQFQISSSPCLLAL